MVPDLIRQLGGPRAVQQRLNLDSHWTPASWARRKSVPVEYWPQIIAMAAERGITVDAEALMRAHAEQSAA